MVLYKGGDEVVAVVIALLHPDLNRIVGGAAGLFNQVRLELLLEKVIRRPLIDEDRSVLGSLTQQLASVIRVPCGGI